MSRHRDRIILSRKRLNILPGTIRTLPWLTESSCSPGRCSGAELLLAAGGVRAFLGSTESSLASSFWATGCWRLGNSTGWVTDFRLLSTRNKPPKNIISTHMAISHIFYIFVSLTLVFLTVWAEVFIGAVWTVLLPITGVGDVNAAAIIALELVVWAVTGTHCGHRRRLHMNSTAPWH